MTGLGMARSRQEGRWPERLLAAGQALLVVLAALAAARLVWAVVTPAGPVGAWQGAAGRAAAAPVALPAVDPFFRESPTAAEAVSDLDLMLVGTRVDTVSGRGSAIIATPDGLQQSFGVGETVLPGVTLLAVEFDSVTLRRGDAEEKLYLDQSDPVPAPDAADTAEPQA